MVARLDIRVTVYRDTKLDDDDIGGAQYSGIAVYTNFPMNIILSPARQAQQQAGLEVPNIYQATCQARRDNANTTIWEHDDVEVTWPEWHQFYGWTFSVISVAEATGRRGRTPLHLIMSRVERSRRLSY